MNTAVPLIQTLCDHLKILLIGTGYPGKWWSHPGLEGFRRHVGVALKDRV